MAPPAVAVVAVAAAVVLLVLLELVVNRAQHLPLPALLLELAADLAHKPLLLAQALLQVVAVLVPLLAVVAVPVELLLSRQSSSAAMARITT